MRKWTRILPALTGPFAAWVQPHNFNALGNQTTKMADKITLRLRSHPWWLLVGMGMWAGLPILFAFRAGRTRRMLQ